MLMRYEEGKTRTHTHKVKQSEGKSRCGQATVHRLNRVGVSVYFLLIFFVIAWVENEMKCLGKRTIEKPVSNQLCTHPQLQTKAGRKEKMILAKLIYEKRSTTNVIDSE